MSSSGFFEFLHLGGFNGITSKPIVKKKFIEFFEIKL